MPLTRWGIAGCGKISSDFVNALQQSGDAENVVVSVAARSLDSAKQFAEKFQAKNFYDSYKALADDPDVDIVYVGVINSGHLGIGKQMLAGGKAVLMEKPLTVCVSHTKELLAEAKASNIFFMEAMWARFIPTYTETRARINRNELGDITHAFATFGVKIENVPRVAQKDLGGGCVLDIGIYAIHFLLWVFNEEKPLEVKATGKLNDQGVEMEVTAVLKFPNNRFGSFMLSTSTNLPNEAFVTGTKGTLKLQPPFWCSAGLTSPSGEFSSPAESAGRSYFFDNSQFLKYEAIHAASCFQQGLKESPVMPHSSTLLLAEIMEDVRKQLGVDLA